MHDQMPHSWMGPEARQFIFKLACILYHLIAPPVGGEQLAVTSMSKAVVDQYNDPPIGLRANDATGCLLHPVEPWILISISKTSATLVIKILFDQVSFQPQLWYAHTYNHNTDQPFSYQVNPFAKDATHDSQPDQRFLVVGRKLSQKVFALCFCHGSVLNEQLSFRQPFFEQLQHGRQI